jgi:sulfur relay (sulfurtransferase) complex TusBCD TusD component (DsrE family)
MADTDGNTVLANALKEQVGQRLKVFLSSRSVAVGKNCTSSLNFLLEQSYQKQKNERLISH